MTVRNLQTSVDYATWGAALAALPNPLDRDYVLEDQDSAIYNTKETIAVANAGFLLTLRGRSPTQKPQIYGLDPGHIFQVTAGRVLFQDLDLRGGLNLWLTGGGDHRVERCKLLSGGTNNVFVIDSVLDVTLQNSLVRRQSGGYPSDGVQLNGICDGFAALCNTFDHTTYNACIYLGLTAGTRQTTFRGNVFRVFGLNNTHAIFKFNDATTRAACSSDYNYFAPNANCSVANGYADLVDWQATGNDANSQFQRGNDPLAEPIFVGGGSWYLDAGSRAVGAGDPSETITDDIDGQVRPQGSAVDLGAYELVVIEPEGVVSSEALGYPMLALAFRVVPDEGGLAGGEAVAFAMENLIRDESRDDAMTAGAIDAAWAVTGRAVAGANGVLLDARAGATVLTHDAVWAHFDARLDVVARDGGGDGGALVELVVLELVVGADVVSVGLRRGVGAAPRVLVGYGEVNAGVRVATGIAEASGRSLRLVRSDQRVWGFVDDAALFEAAVGPAGLGTLRIASRGAAGRPVTARVKNFRVLSGATLGGRLVTSAADAGLRRLTGVTPAGADVGTVEAVVFGLFGRTVRANAFSYTLGTSRRVGVAGARTLVAT